MNDALRLDKETEGISASVDLAAVQEMIRPAFSAVPAPVLVPTSLPWIIRRGSCGAWCHWVKKKKSFRVKHFRYVRLATIAPYDALGGFP